MKGKMLDYNMQNHTGMISGDDGQRYKFAQVDWKSDIKPMPGQVIDFTVSGDTAQDIYVEKALSEGKSKIAAALLAFFLGALGIHKFYLGCNKAGIIMLLCFFPGMFLFMIPTIIVSVIAFVEFIIYLTKSDAEFQTTYIDNQKCWF